MAAIHSFPTYNCTTINIADFPQSLSHDAVPLFIHGHTLTAHSRAVSWVKTLQKCSHYKSNPQLVTYMWLPVRWTRKYPGTVRYTSSTMDLIIRMFASVYRKICVVMSFLAMIFTNSTNIWSSTWGGPKPGLVTPFHSDITCAVSAASIGNDSLFTNILPTCRPIATRSRHFSVDDKAFIQNEIVKLPDTG